MKAGGKPYNQRKKMTKNNETGFRTMLTPMELADFGQASNRAEHKKPARVAGITTIQVFISDGTNPLPPLRAFGGPRKGIMAFEVHSPVSEPAALCQMVQKEMEFFFFGGIEREISGKVHGRKTASRGNKKKGGK
jgi:hypothetical protein